MIFRGSHAIILFVWAFVHLSSCAPKPNILLSPTDEEPNAICPPDTIYVNGTCITRCPGSTMPTDDSCVQCPPDSEYSNGQCVQCNEGMLLKNGRCTCPPRMALLNGECVNVKLQQCKENEILSEGKCIPLYCYGNKCCQNMLCNTCFLSCQQLTLYTATLSKCQRDCINGILPSIPPFLVEVEQGPALLPTESPPIEVHTYPNEIPPIIVNQPSLPVYPQPDVYSPVMVNQPSPPIYTQPNVFAPIIVNRPSSPIYTRPNVLPPIVVSRPSTPVIVPPNPIPQITINQPQPQIIPQQQPPVIYYQPSSKPAKLISGSKGNSTTFMNITNIVNNTNLENIRTKINNTNINHIKLGSSASDGYEITVNGEEANQEIIEKEVCCIIKEPRTCLNDTNRVVCYHRRHHVCGDRCYELKEIIDTEEETNQKIIDNSMPVQQQTAIYPQQPMQQPIFYQQPSIQSSYVPQYYQQPILMQPQVSYQPQGMCSYIPQWPFVRC